MSRTGRQIRRRFATGCLRCEAIRGGRGRRRARGASSRIWRAVSPPDRDLTPDAPDGSQSAAALSCSLLGMPDHKPKPASATARLLHRSRPPAARVHKELVVSSTEKFGSWEEKLSPRSEERHHLASEEMAKKLAGRSFDDTPRGSPRGTPRGSPRGTPRGTPRTLRRSGSGLCAVLRCLPAYVPDFLHT